MHKNFKNFWGAFVLDPIWFQNTDLDNFKDAC